MCISVCKLKCTNTLYLYIPVLRPYIYIGLHMYIYIYTAIVVTRYHNHIYCYISSLYITYHTYIYTYISTFTLVIYVIYIYIYILYIYIYILFSIDIINSITSFILPLKFFYQNNATSICNRIYAKWQ